MPHPPGRIIDMNIMTVRAATPFIFRRKSDQKIQIAENRQFFLLFVEGLRGSGFRPEASQPSITNIKTQQRRHPRTKGYAIATAFAAAQSLCQDDYAA